MKTAVCLPLEDFNRSGMIWCKDKETRGVCNETTS